MSTNENENLPSTIARELLIFGQIHTGTSNYFKPKTTNNHTIPILQTPHYEFISNQSKETRRKYLHYLKISWKYYGLKNNIFSRKKQLRKFLNLYTDISNGLTIDPIEVLERPDGKLIVLDGNHRASIAIHLNLTLPVAKKNIIETFSKITSVPDSFYGSGNRNAPYQSILVGKEIIIEGRRKDLAERNSMMDANDIYNKNILDLGSNLGQSLNLAIESGANSGVGIESLSKVATAAMRLNTYYSANVEFLNLDLNTSSHFIKKFDTIFCFSVFRHVINKGNLIETIHQNLGRVLYLEGHSGDVLEDYIELIEAIKFSKIELIGFLPASAHDNRRSRPFWRLDLMEG